MEKNNVIVQEVKDQVKVHIKDAVSQLEAVLEFLNGSDDFSAIKQDIQSKSQSSVEHIMHGLALVTKRAKLDHTMDAIFYEVKKEVEYQVDASKIKVPHGSKGRVDTIHQTEEEKHWCDLSQDQILTAEKIIRSALSNPLRAKYQKLPWANDQIYEKESTPEFYLDFLTNKCQKALHSFDEQQIKLYDTSRFDLHESEDESTKIDKQKWLKHLKTSRFYGPFQTEYHSAFSFQSITEDGSFAGIRLTINFAKHGIVLSYSTDHNHDAGKPHEFYNEQQ